MAFWKASSSAQQPSLPAAPAQPRAFIVRPGSGPAGPLTSSSSLVRLRVDLAADAGAAAAAAGDPDDDGDEAALRERSQAAASAVARLHRAILGIEQRSEEARTLAVLEVLQDGTLQVLTTKAVVAKVYKSLLPHAAAVGYSMAPAKACLSTKPVAASDLQAALQTAVAKTLTGSSSGVPTTNTITAGADAAAGQQQRPAWMCLSRTRLVRGDVLRSVPGELAMATFAELEVTADAGHMLLMVRAAGRVKLRLFSPLSALRQDASGLPACLSAASDTDASLLADPAKLAAAAWALDGRAVKLLPDERLAFIKSLSAPSDPAQQQQLADWWLGHHGLQLPASYPFLIGVAGSPEADEVELQVPSCCVLTTLGLSQLPGGYAAAVQQLLADLQANAAACGFWGNSLHVEMRDGTQGSSQTQQGAPRGSQPKAFTLSTQWTTAAGLQALQERAEPPPPEAIGLMEAEVSPTVAATAAASQPGSGRQMQEGQGHSSSAAGGKERWQGLHAYLAELQQQQHAGLGQGKGGSLGALRATAMPSSSHAGSAAAAAGATRAAALAAAAGRPPTAPSFGNRRPATGGTNPAVRKAATAAAGRGLSKAAGAAAASRPAGPVLAAADAGAGSAAALAGSAAAAAGSAVGAAAPKVAVVLGKRPAAANAKQPVAKKQAAGAAGAKPKAPKKAAAAAAAGGGAAVPAEGAPGAPAEVSGPAAAAAQQPRKRTKASDLDAAAVGGKVQAAFAASGGVSLKGVSVLEMQCFLKASGVKASSAKRADVEARLLALLAPAGGAQPAAV